MIEWDFLMKKHVLQLVLMVSGGVIDIHDNVYAPFIYNRAYNPGYKNAIGLECCSGATIYLIH